MRLRKASSSSLVKLDVFVLYGEVVDAALRRRDPRGHLAGLGHLLHERMDEGAVALRGDPIVEPALVFMTVDLLPGGVDRHARPGPDRAAEARGGEREAQGVARALDHAVPALEADL